MVMNKADVCNTGVCRPGGFTITDRALEFCSFKKGAKLLDVGCGLGATVRRGTDEYGLDVYGIEKDKEVLALAKARLTRSPTGCGLAMPCTCPLATGRWTGCF